VRVEASASATVATRKNARSNMRIVVSERLRSVKER
jgi:hypothetical protein